MASSCPFVNPSNLKITCSHPISLKLDEKNFRKWKQQIEGMAHGHKLEHFVNLPAFHHAFSLILIVKLMLLIHCILTGNSEMRWSLHGFCLRFQNLFSRVVDCTYSWHIWDEIHKYFHNLLSTKARQLRSKLRLLTKGNRTVDEFMLRVHAISDSLLSLRDPIPHCNLVETMLEALPKEFDSVVVAVNSKSDLCSLDELESLLLEHHDWTRTRRMFSLNLFLWSNPSFSSRPQSKFIF